MILLCITYCFISQYLCYVTSLTCTCYGVLGWPTMLIYNMHIIQFYFNRGFQANDTLISVLMEVSMGQNVTALFVLHYATTSTSHLKMKLKVKKRQCWRKCMIVNEF